MHRLLVQSFAYDHFHFRIPLDFWTAYWISSVILSLHYHTPDLKLLFQIHDRIIIGKNIIEVKRCLATNGHLLIAETTISLNGRLSKLRDVLREQGFEICTDEESGDFTFIEARAL